MNLSLLLLHDSNTNEDDIHTISKKLENVYQIKIGARRIQEIDSFAFDASREQYDGQKLLNKLIDDMKLEFFFWIIQDDLFVPLMNFVFGLASKYHGAIISFYRLENLDMKIKECIHECGHIYGLGHCDNECVMQYSNSLSEALEKPPYLCDECKTTLQKNKDFLYKAKNK
ncbi:MAG: peptidase [Candidatus Heimdallarchaeota archaeon]|nr:peptidase [Candidatus Heimdallarchaeota archaeon]MCK4955149.1 peptidase [Candidatus Heimdallarchaeota archaeon]